MLVITILFLSMAPTVCCCIHYQPLMSSCSATSLKRCAPSGAKNKAEKEETLLEWKVRSNCGSVLLERCVLKKEENTPKMKSFKLFIIEVWHLSKCLCQKRGELRAWNPPNLESTSFKKEHIILNSFQSAFVLSA